MALATGCAAAPAAEAPLAAPPTAPPAAAATRAIPSPVPTAAPAAPTPAPPTSTPQPDPPTSTPQPAPTSSAIPPTATAQAAGEAEILFLREGNLVAFGVDTRGERTLAEGVRAFAATRDGQTLAMVRGEEIWVTRRDGSQPRQITDNGRAEGDLSWAPDGSALAYSSAEVDGPRALTWEGWSRWCAASEARVIEMGDLVERTLAPGCEPAFGPDGRRIAFASPPSGQAPGLGFAGVGNAVRLVNRQGQNGWDFASADGQSEGRGSLVYAPAWSPSGEQIAYQRFLGYQALVDINIAEIGPAFKGDGRPLASGAGWMLPPQFGPGGGLAALIEHNFSDARGASGYEIWRLSLVRLGVEGSMFLPSGEIPTVGSVAWQASRVTAAAWAPDGEALALAMPAGWQPDAPAQDLLYQNEGPGEVWLWGADGAPRERLIEGVDYASPLIWLPA